MRLKIALSTFVFGGVLLLGACSKKNTDSVVKPKLIGTWREMQTAQDSNLDGVRQASEIEDVASSTVNTIRFKDDGTVLFSDNYGHGPTEYNATWQLINSDAQLKITFTDSSSVLNGVSNYPFIESVSSTQLVIEDTSGGYLSWAFYIKQ